MATYIFFMYCLLMFHLLAEVLNFIIVTQQPWLHSPPIPSPVGWHQRVVCLPIVPLRTVCVLTSYSQPLTGLHPPLLGQHASHTGFYLSIILFLLPVPGCNIGQFCHPIHLAGTKLIWCWMLCNTQSLCLFSLACHTLDAQERSPCWIFFFEKSRQK